MKNLLLLIALVWTSLEATAQITVPATTFPVPGDVLRYVQASNPDIAIALYTPPGGGQVWDLSMLTQASNIETNYRPAAEGVYKDDFPTASMVVKNGTTEDYYASSGTAFIYLGQAATAVGGLPLLAIYKYAPPLIERHAPLNFFDIYQSSSVNFIGWSFSQIPTGAFTLPITPDSIRFRYYKQVLKVVDAWGTLTLPGMPTPSSFSVLRVKQTDYQASKIDAKVPLLGWLEVTDQVIQGGGPWANLFGVDTLVTHHYFHDVSKEAIAVLTFNNDQNAVNKVVFKNVSPMSSANEAEEAQAATLQIYPNPASTAVTIRCNKAHSGEYVLKIFNSIGTLVAVQSGVLADKEPIQVDLPTGLSGLCFCRLEYNAGHMLGTGRVTVIR